MNEDLCRSNRRERFDAHEDNRTIDRQCKSISIAIEDNYELSVQTMDYRTMKVKSRQEIYLLSIVIEIFKRVS